MLIRSILTVAVLASFVFGAAANASPAAPATNLTAQIDGISAPMSEGFASAGGLGTTRR
ncbi:hypothetical protein [Gymnodinialimonas sp. 57CJ19]|uniref:hypothetical protein n=1 Tax=Gymnodinialimonas sp. 57CJ19 TaxID=3138498 RepID=UPI0031342628